MYKRHINCERIIFLNNTFRKLWKQHVMWTRSFIISAVDGLGDLDFVAKRLMRNPADFAAVLKKYYSIEKVNEFQELFTAHLSIAGNLVNQAKAGNAKGVETERKKWYINAAEIAAFLSGINPYWSRTEWKKCLTST